MAFTETLLHGALKLVATLYPQTAPFVAAAEKWGPVAAPVIISALHEGGSALAAAEKAAPELAKSVKNLVARVQAELPATGGFMSKPAPVVTENLFRTMAGFPRMTPEQERVWMDDATPHNDPSQENSNVGSG